METNNPKTYNKKLTYFLIWGPVIGVPLVLILFALVNTILGADSFSYSQNTQLTLTLANFFLGLFGLIFVIGLFTALPYGIYRLKKSGSTKDITKTENGQKFIENTKFKSISGLFKTVMVLNILQILISLYLTFPMLKIYQGITNPSSLSSDEQLFIINFNYDAFSNGLIALSLFAGLIFLIWLHAAYKNLYSFGEKTNNTPGWVVGEFFIPILNLIAPYRNMKELYKKTTKSHDTKLILGWWLTLLFAGFIGRYVETIANNPNTTDAQLANTIGLSIFSIFVGISSLILAIILLKKITASQIERANKNTADSWNIS